MAQQVIELSPGGDVRAVTTYVVNDGTVRPYGQAQGDDREVVFHDMRSAADQPTLDREGFCLVSHPTSVTDFNDPGQVLTRYFPEIVDLVRKLTGVPDVYMQQNWVFRGDDRKYSTVAVSERNSVTNFQTHGMLHADYYEHESAEALAARAMAAAGVTERPRGRLLGINTWRSLAPAPVDRPLALVDRRTLDEADFVPAVIGGPGRGGGLTSLCSSYNPGHRLCWWSNMTPDEVLVFLQYEEGHGPKSTVMHTAFTDPGCPPGTHPRQSIEARAYVFIEDGR